MNCNHLCGIIVFPVRNNLLDVTIVRNTIKLFKPANDVDEFIENNSRVLTSGLRSIKASVQVLDVLHKLGVVWGR